MSGSEVEQEPAEDDEGRRYPSTIGGLFYLMILSVAVVGVVITTSGDWRLGLRWIAAGLFAAATLRLVLPAKDAGMLAVRQRFVDVGFLAGSAAALLFLATTIPDQPV